MRATRRLACSLRGLKSEVEPAAGRGGGISAKGGGGTAREGWEPVKFRGAAAAAAAAKTAAMDDPTVLPFWHAPATLIPQPVLRVQPDGTGVFEDRPHAAACMAAQVAQYFSSNRLPIQEGAVVVDVGANTGSFATEVLRRTGGRSDVICMEPVPSTAAVLRLNLAHLPYRESAKVLHCGAGAEPGFKRFTYPVGSSPSASYRPGDLPEPEEIAAALSERDAAGNLPEAFQRVMGGKKEGETAEARKKRMLASFNSRLMEEVDVEVRRLADVFRDFRLPRVDVLKIDVEGAEEDVLLGLDAPGWDLVQRVVVEVHDVSGRLESISDLLRSQGLVHQVREQAPEAAGWSNLWLLWGSKTPF